MVLQDVSRKLDQSQKELKRLESRLDEIAWDTKWLKSAEFLQHLRITIQRRASESTADYVLKNMAKTKAVYSKEEILYFAVEEAVNNSTSLAMEFGVYEGHTINQIANQWKGGVFGFDSFEGLPEDWRTGFESGRFAIENIPKVPSNTRLIKGWFDDTLPDIIDNIDGELTLLHIDSDLYSSAATIFSCLANHISSGCVIIFDEYFNYPNWEQGEFKAFQEFVSQHGIDYEYLAYNASHEQVVVRIISPDSR